MQKRGVLIAIEGIDGAGKSTQARLLVEWLKSRGIEAEYSREPTDGPIGRLIVEMMELRTLSPPIDALLFAADRLHHYASYLLPTLERGCVVVCDRYLHSSLAYQGATVGDVEWVRCLNKHVPPPDLGIYIDVEPEIGISRKRGRSSIFEDVNLLRRAREIYLDFVRSGELTLIDGRHNVEEVSRLVVETVSSMLPGLI